MLFCLFSSLNFQETRIWVSIRRQCRSRAGVAAMCVPPAFLSNCCFPPASLEGCPPPRQRCIGYRAEEPVWTQLGAQSSPGGLLLVPTLEAPVCGLHAAWGQVRAWALVKLQGSWLGTGGGAVGYTMVCAGGRVPEQREYPARAAGRGRVAQWVTLSAEAPAPFPIQLPANAPEDVAGGGPRAWALHP